MTKRTRRNHSPYFKAKVALGAVKGDKTIAQLSDQHGVHVSQITTWKEQLQDGAAVVFGATSGTTAKKVPIYPSIKWSSIATVVLPGRSESRIAVASESPRRMRS